MFAIKRDLLLQLVMLHIPVYTFKSSNFCQLQYFCLKISALKAYTILNKIVCKNPSNRCFFIWRVWKGEVRKTLQQGKLRNWKIPNNLCKRNIKNIIAFALVKLNKIKIKIKPKRVGAQNKHNFNIWAYWKKVLLSRLKR